MKALVNKLMNRDQRCAVLITSSLAAGTLMPGITSYCATKAAISNFGESLNFELSKNVDVTVWEPGYVHSNIHLEKPPSLLTLSAEDAVADVLKDLGKKRTTKGSLVFEWLPVSKSEMFAKQLLGDITSKRDKLNEAMIKWAL